MENKTIGAPQIKITPEMMKSFKTLTCDCGGQLFESGVVIKKISPLIAPSGKEEAYPLEVLVCKACGKVPNELNIGDMLPASVMATPVPASAKFEFPKSETVNKAQTTVKESTLRIVKQDVVTPKDELS